MTERIRAKIKAAAYEAVAEVGKNEAIRLLREAIREIEADQWRGGSPGSYQGPG